METGLIFKEKHMTPNHFRKNVNQIDSFNQTLK